MEYAYPIWERSVKVFLRILWHSLNKHNDLAMSIASIGIYHQYKQWTLVENCVCVRIQWRPGFAIIRDCSRLWHCIGLTNFKILKPLNFKTSCSTLKITRLEAKLCVAYQRVHIFYWKYIYIYIYIYKLLLKKGKELKMEKLTHSFREIDLQLI